MSVDPFDTAALRDAALSAWTTSPTRFREDANLEADHARVHYRDRVVVELAQNAADAATQGGVPGRLLLRLERFEEYWRLVAANTGRPLDLGGVRSLAALRASAKGAQRGAVGRLGVGFAAVRAVCDDVAIGAGDHAVAFSLARTLDALEGSPGLHAVARERGRDVPVLRLPFPSSVEVPQGYDTAVVMVLRDDAALAEIRAQLADVNDLLALALPALDEIAVEVVDGPPQSFVVRDVADRWTVRTRTGLVDPALVAELPLEERPERWSVTWAVPRKDSPACRVPLDRFLAPTRTDEASSFPAALLATFPIDPARRHVTPGPWTTALAGYAAAQYVDLLAELARNGDDVFDLIPGGGLPAGELDALVRGLVHDAVRLAPILPGVDAGSVVAPSDATVVRGPFSGDRAVLAALGIPAAAVVGESRVAAAREWGAQVMSLADAVDEAGSAVAGRVWELCTALERYADVPGVLDALAGLPIPLSDGRIAAGPRGLLLPDAVDCSRTAFPALRGLRLIDAAAAHPLLERAGAIAADAERIAHAVRGDVLELADDCQDGQDPDLVRHTALLGIAAAALAEGGSLDFWWGELPLPTRRGYVAARECLLPESWAQDIVAGLDLVDEELVNTWGAEVVGALGVVSQIAVWHVADVVTPSGPNDIDPHSPQAWLAHWDEYLEFAAHLVGPGILLGDLTAIADLDLVGEDAWGRFLAALSASPQARAALLAPVRAMAGTSERVLPSYTAWWLREEWGAPFARGFSSGFVPPIPPEFEGVDDQVARALGVVSNLTELDASLLSNLADLLGEVGERVAPLDALAWWSAAWAMSTDGAAQRPDRVVALGPDGARVVESVRAAVAPDPRWAPLRPVVPAPASRVEAVARWLGCVIAPAGQIPDQPGVTVRIDPQIADLVGARRWCQHEELTVDEVAVRWWVEDSDVGATVHAVDHEGLARGLAAASGDYSRRHTIGALLAASVGVDGVLWESGWDGPPTFAP